MGDTHLDAITHFPARLTKQEGQWLLEWLQTPERELGAPFFEDTIRRARVGLCEHRRGRLQCLSTLDFLTDRHRQYAAPAAIIYHVSRCGSTLLAQLFNQTGKFRCLSEVPLFDQLLAVRSEWNAAEWRDLLAAAVASLSAPNRPTLIKTDSWHLFHSDVYQTCFPNAPTILLYRNPVEVWRSHARQPGSHVVPGLLSDAQLNGALSGEERAMAAKSYFATILTKYFSRMLRMYETQPACLLVNYSEGAKHMVTRVARHMGAVLSEEDLAVVESRARFDSKHPQNDFSARLEGNEAVDFLDECLALYSELDSLNPRASGVT